MVLWFCWNLQSWHTKIASTIQINIFRIASWVRKGKKKQIGPKCFRYCILFPIERYTKKFYQSVKLNKCCARLRSDVVSRRIPREHFGKRRRSGGNNGAGINNTAAKDPEEKKVDRSWTAWLLLPVTTPLGTLAEEREGWFFRWSAQPSLPLRSPAEKR